MTFESKALVRVIKTGLRDIGYTAYESNVSAKAWGKIADFSEAALQEPERNIALRTYLSNRWKKATYAEKLSIAQWIVKDWGGIVAIKDETLDRYVSLAESGSQYPFEGVSSYSKILAIKDPSRFAIYDARVAASLNCLQLLGETRVLAFPVPISRNSQINNSMHTGFADRCTMSWLKKNGFSAEPLHQVYGIYCNLLSELSKQTENSILQIEMTLFSTAIDLIRRVREDKLLDRAHTGNVRVSD